MSTYQMKYSREYGSKYIKKKNQGGLQEKKKRKGKSPGGDGIPAEFLIK